MSEFLKIVGLKKTYAEGKGSLPVLNGIDLTVNAGETVSIMGASGAGKSTLLHIIGTLDSASDGTVFFEGEDIGCWSEEECARFRNEKLGFVFQFHHLLNDFSALENVAMPLLLRGYSSKQRLERGMQVLSEVGLADRKDSLPTELSGGEQQRIAVARAVVADPVLLLADEPTGNLDAQTGDGLMDLLFELNRRRGLTLIFVSHNEKLASRTGRTLLLQDGIINSEK